MKAVKVLSLIALVLLAGSIACRKRQPAAPPPAPESVNPAAPAQKLATGHVVPVTLREFESSVVLADLNKNLQIFLTQKQRLPADLNELARDSGMPIPKPPPGTKLVIDPRAKAVKVVPQ
jgi:hypothetical protein